MRLQVMHSIDSTEETFDLERSHFTCSDTNPGAPGPVVETPRMEILGAQ